MGVVLWIACRILDIVENVCKIWTSQSYAESHPTRIKKKHRTNRNKSWGVWEGTDNKHWRNWKAITRGKYHSTLAASN
jgi:hypothetical protein